MFRRDFVSNWLESVINSENSKKILEYLDNLTNLILCHKISDACELALENGDMNLSLLIAQISSNHTLREFIKEQFVCWNEIEASEFIDERRLKIMMIISGIPTLSTSRNSIVNIFENQNWLRCFAICLWFTSSPIASVTDAVMAYENSFQDEDLNVAVPVYRSNHKYVDIRYHLMKLFSQKSYSLESLLHPAGYSSDQTDYALSFLVSQVLETLDYHHLSDACKLILVFLNNTFY
jgi:nuclear pore complex protein Nup98-Nup96